MSESDVMAAMFVRDDALTRWLTYLALSASDGGLTVDQVGAQVGRALTAQSHSGVGSDRRSMTAVLERLRQDSRVPISRRRRGGDLRKARWHVNARGMAVAVAADALGDVVPRTGGVTPLRPLCAWLTVALVRMCGNSVRQGELRDTLLSTFNESLADFLTSDEMDTICTILEANSFLEVKEVPWWRSPSLLDWSVQISQWVWSVPTVAGDLTEVANKLVAICDERGVMPMRVGDDPEIKSPPRQGRSVDDAPTVPELAVEIFKVLSESPGRSWTARQINDQVLARFGIEVAEDAYRTSLSRRPGRVWHHLHHARQALRGDKGAGKGAGVLDSTSWWPNNQEDDDATYQLKDEAQQVPIEHVRAEAERYTARKTYVINRPTFFQDGSVSRADKQGMSDLRFAYDHKRWAWETLKAVVQLHTVGGEPVRGSEIAEQVATQFALSEEARRIRARRHPKDPDAEYAVRSATMRLLLRELGILSGSSTKPTKWQPTTLGSDAYTQGRPVVATGRDEPWSTMENLRDEFEEANARRTLARVVGPESAYRGNPLLDAAIDDTTPVRSTSGDVQRSTAAGEASPSPDGPAVVDGAADTTDHVINDALEMLREIQLWAPADKQQLYAALGKRRNPSITDEQLASNGFKLTMESSLMVLKSVDAVSENEAGALEVTSTGAGFATVSDLGDRYRDRRDGGLEVGLPPVGPPLPKDIIELPHLEDMLTAVLEVAASAGDDGLARDGIADAAERWLRDHTTYTKPEHYKWAASRARASEYRYRIDFMVGALSSEEEYLQIVDGGQQLRLAKHAQGDPNDAADVSANVEAIARKINSDPAYQPESWTHMVINRIKQFRELGPAPAGEAFEELVFDLIDASGGEVVVERNTPADHRNRNLEGTPMGDGGWDGQFVRNSVTWLYSCKLKAGEQKVSVQEAREFNTAVSEHDTATHGQFFTVGEFSGEAENERKTWRENTVERINFVDGQTLARLMRSIGRGLQRGGQGEVVGLDEEYFRQFEDRAKPRADKEPDSGAQPRRRRRTAGAATDRPRRVSLDRSLVRDDNREAHGLAGSGGIPRSDEANQPRSAPDGQVFEQRSLEWMFDIGEWAQAVLKALQTSAGENHEAVWLSNVEIAGAMADIMGIDEHARQYVSVHDGKTAEYRLRCEAGRMILRDMGLVEAHRRNVGEPPKLQNGWILTEEGLTAHQEVVAEWVTQNIDGWVPGRLAKWRGDSQLDRIIAGKS